MEKQASTNELDVVMRHVVAFKARDLDAVMRDYSDNAVLITPEQTFRGVEEVRSFVQGAMQQFPPELFESITMMRIDSTGDVVYGLWHAEPFKKSPLIPLLSAAVKLWCRPSCSCSNASSLPNKKETGACRSLFC